MEKEAASFLEAEETAQKLVETLRKLQTEAASYSTAAKELNEVKLELLNLIESTKNGVERSQAIIKLLGDIGGPEIINRLARLEEASQKSFSIQAGQVDKLRVYLIATFATAVIAVIISIILLVS